jgi:GH35 family endo-1,4-beta-xylanase
MACGSPRAPSTRLHVEQLEDRQVLSAGAPTLGLAAPLPTTNLVTAPSFEEGLGNAWAVTGVSLARSTAQAHSGANSAFVSGRQQTWHGVNFQIPFTGATGDELAFSAWVRLQTGPTQIVNLTLRQVDDLGERFIHVTHNEVSSNAWTEVRGGVQMDIAGRLRELTLLVEGPAVGTNFFVDDVTIGPFQWRTAADARIEQIRKGNANVRVVDQFGQPIPGTTIEIRQTRSDFAFGSAINNNVLTNPAYADFAKRAFDWATVEYEATWPSNEPTRGIQTHSIADAIIDWARQNGLQLRGHHLVDSQQGPSWLRGLSTMDILAEVDQRLIDALGHYQGDFAQWDVVNEMLSGRFYQDSVGAWFNPWVYLRTKQIDPSVQLFTNEFNIIEGSLVEEYKDLIRALQSYGVTIDGVGVQSHLPGRVEPFTMLSRLDSLAELGLPIWSTEFDVAAKDEWARADEIEKYLRLAYSHPGVEGVMLWDFFAGSASRDPNRALMDADGRINAAGQRYLALRQEWSTRLSPRVLTSDAVSFRGFLGTYEAILTLPDGSKLTQTFQLDSNGTNDITLTQTLRPRLISTSSSIAWFNEPYPFTMITLDHLGQANMNPGSFTYEIDWNNDGSFETTWAGNSLAPTSGTFHDFGFQSFSYRVRDGRGAYSDVGQTTVWVAGYIVLQDADYPDFFHLIWIGTPGNDSITLRPSATGGVLAEITQIDGVSISRTSRFEKVNGVVLAIGVDGVDTISNLAGIPVAPEPSRTSASDGSSTGTSSSLDPTLLSPEHVDLLIAKNDEHEDFLF